MADVYDDDDNTAIVKAKDDAIVADAQAITVFGPFELAHVTVQRLSVSAHGGPDALGDLTIKASQVALRRRRPDDACHSWRSSSATHSPRRKAASPSSIAACSSTVSGSS